MNKRSVITLIGIPFFAFILLMGCGLNQRSLAGNDPVPVEVNPDNGGDNGGADGQSNEQPPAEGEGNAGQTDDGSAEPAPPAGEDNEGDGYVAPETPREEEPADGNQGDGGEQAQDPTPVPPTAVPPTEVPATVAPQTGDGKHVVVAGDTLFSIAQRYGLTVSELAAANGIVNPNVLDVGEELVIPAPGTVTLPETASTHIVSYGETLFSIAVAYGFTVDEIAIFNNISNVNRIDVGQEIKIPSR